MTIQRKNMNDVGKGIAVVGLILFVIGLFGTAQCQTIPVSFFNDEEETECLALLDLDPFEEGQDAHWEQWVGRNRFALFMIGALLGSLIALLSDDRFAILVGGLGLLAVAGMIYIELSIQISEADTVSLEWAWMPLLLGAACLMFSSVPVDPPYIATSSAAGDPALGTPPIQPQPVSPPPRSFESRAALTTARILAGIGIVILLFGGTFAPAFCDDESFSRECGIGGDGSFFNDEPFDESFKEGVQQNFISISIMLLSALALLATVVKRPIAVAVSGWTPLGYLILIYVYFWAAASAGEDSITEFTEWGWIGLIGGPLLLIIAASRFKLSEEEALAESWRQSRHSYGQTPAAPSTSAAPEQWATPTSDVSEAIEAADAEVVEDHSTSDIDAEQTDRPETQPSDDTSSAVEDDPTATDKTPD